MKNFSVESLLGELVAIPSVFPDELPLAQYIEGVLLELGFQVARVPSSAQRYSLVASYGEASSYLGFYGHMDTVPVAPEYGARNPFNLQFEGDIVRGLGVVDMKAGLSAMLMCGRYAVINKLPLKLVFGVDEENVSKGAYDLIASALLADVGFLVVGESGQVVDFEQDFSLCYGRKGRIAFELEVRGKKAHAASAHEGVNAIEEAARLILEMRKLALPAHARLGVSQTVVQNIDAKADSFSLPDSCRFTLSLLTVPGFKSQQFVDLVLDLPRSLGVDVKINLLKRETPYAESYEVDKSNPFLQRLEREVFAKYRVAPIYTPSVADENIFANRLGIPVISLGPIGAGDHTAQEWLDLRSLNRVAQAYVEVLNLWHS